MKQFGSDIHLLPPLQFQASINYQWFPSFSSADFAWNKTLENVPQQSHANVPPPVRDRQLRSSNVEWRPPRSRPNADSGVSRYVSQSSKIRLVKVVTSSLEPMVTKVDSIRLIPWRSGFSLACKAYIRLTPKIHVLEKECSVTPSHRLARLDGWTRDCGVLLRVITDERREWSDYSGDRIHVVLKEHVSEICI